MKPLHRRGSYQRRAAMVRRAANANPHTLCWRCGLAARHGDPWQAGHIHDGEIDGELRAEHRSCNIVHENERRLGRDLSAQLSPTRAR